MASTFTYTLIPCDASEPMQEFTLPVPPTLEENIGCLTSALNDYYRRTAPLGTGAQKEAVMDTVRDSLKKNGQNAPVDEGMLGALAQSQTVDIVQLLSATAKSGYVGVSMYVDDKGQGKGSAPNARASAICTACGVPTDVVGDVFVARAWDDQDGFERQDLTIADLSSDAPWVREAVALNAGRANPAEAEAKMKALQATGKKRKPPPDLPLAERLAAAAAAKAAGTDTFKKGEMEGAAAKYEEAIELLGGPEGVVGDAGSGAEGASGAGAAGGGEGGGGAEGEASRAAAELLITCLVNVAMCRLKQERPYEAIEAADSALALDDANGKAWYRRGQACMALQQYGAAKKNLGRAATLLPSSREVREDYTKCQALAAEKRASAFDGL
jgi:tetratricopeptide (TPR) repeat protein